MFCCGELLRYWAGLQYDKCDEKGIEGVECSCENSCNFKTSVIAETCSVI